MGPTQELGLHPSVLGTAREETARYRFSENNFGSAVGLTPKQNFLFEIIY